MAATFEGSVERGPLVGVRYDRIPKCGIKTANTERGGGGIMLS